MAFLVASGDSTILRRRGSLIGSRSQTLSRLVAAVAFARTPTLPLATGRPRRTEHRESTFDATNKRALFMRCQLSLAVATAASARESDGLATEYGFDLNF